LSAVAQQAKAEATKQSILSFRGEMDCVAEPVTGARIRATRRHGASRLSSRLRKPFLIQMSNNIGYADAFSRREFAPELLRASPSKLKEGRRECRVKASPHGPPAAKKAGGSHHRFSQIIGRSLRNGFNGVFRVLPRGPGFLAPSPARRGSVCASLAQRRGARTTRLRRP
jgi:hypothetical protein